MPALARGDVERLLRFVAEADGLGAEHPFSEELLTELGRIVGADWLGYNELDCVRRKVHLIVERPGDVDEIGLTEEGWTLLEAHPLCQAHARGDFRTLKLSDFLSDRENVYGKLGVNTRTAAVARFLGLEDAGESAAAAGV